MLFRLNDIYCYCNEIWRQTAVDNFENNLKNTNFEGKFA